MTTPNQSVEKVAPGTLMALVPQERANPAVPYDVENPSLGDVDVTEPSEQRISGNDDPDPQELHNKAKELD